MDHRKTAFFQTCLGVFQGGGCRAAAFVGAYEEAVKHGVHFAEVAGTSAGSVTAALIGAGANPEQLKSSIDKLDFNKFMKEPDPVPQQGWGKSVEAALWVLRRTSLKRYTYIISNLGMYSSSKIEEWMEEELRSLLNIRGNDPVIFDDLPIPTWVIATDLETGKVKSWSKTMTPGDKVAEAVRASCSIPIFFQPTLSHYVDGGTLSNLPAFVFANSDKRPVSSRILAFALETEGDNPDLSTAPGLINGLINSVVYGSLDLQLQLQKGVNVISIPTGHIKATDFDKMNADAIKFLVEKGRDATHTFFQAGLGRVHTTPPLATLRYDEDEVYAAVTENLGEPVDTIIISEETTGWVYSLYPSLLYWRAMGVRIKVLLNKEGDSKKDGPYRRRVLSSLGAEVYLTDNVPARAYLFDPQDQGRANAIVWVRSIHLEVANRYNGSYDFPVIDALRSQIESLCVPASDQKMATNLPKLIPFEESQLITLLRNVPQYTQKGIELSLQEIPIDSLTSLTRYVEEYKCQQMGRLMELYKRDRLNCFEPVAVDYGNNRSSIMTPPVVEQSGDEYFLIQGTARAVYCRDHGIDKVLGVVVGAGQYQKELPTDNRVNIKGVLIAGRKMTMIEKYGERLNYDLFRHIENKMHPVDSLQ